MFFKIIPSNPRGGDLFTTRLDKFSKFVQSFRKSSMSHKSKMCFFPQGCFAITLHHAQYAIRNTQYAIRNMPSGGEQVIEGERYARHVGWETSRSGHDYCRIGPRGNINRNGDFWRYTSSITRMGSKGAKDRKTCAAAVDQLRLRGFVIPRNSESLLWALDSEFLGMTNQASVERMISAL